MLPFWKRKLHSSIENAEMKTSGSVEDFVSELCLQENASICLIPSDGRGDQAFALLSSLIEVGGKTPVHLKSIVSEKKGVISSNSVVLSTISEFSAFYHHQLFSPINSINPVFSLPVFVWDADSLFDGRVQGQSLPLAVSGEDDKQERKILQAFYALAEKWSAAERGCFEGFYEHIIDCNIMSDNDKSKLFVYRFWSAYSELNDYEEVKHYVVHNGQIVWASGEKRTLSSYHLQDHFIHTLISIRHNVFSVQKMSNSVTVNTSFFGYLNSSSDVKLYMKGVPHQSRLHYGDSKALPFTIGSSDSKKSQNHEMNSFFSSLGSEKVRIVVATKSYWDGLSQMPDRFSVVTFDQLFLDSENDTPAMVLQMPSCEAHWLSLIELAGRGVKVCVSLCRGDERLDEASEMKWAMLCFSNGSQPSDKTQENIVDFWRKHWKSCASRSVAFNEDDISLSVLIASQVNKARNIAYEDCVEPKRKAESLNLYKKIQQLNIENDQLSSTIVWAVFFHCLGDRLKKLEECKVFSLLAESVSGDSGSFSKSQRALWKGIC